MKRPMVGIVTAYIAGILIGHWLNCPFIYLFIVMGLLLAASLIILLIKKDHLLILSTFLLFISLSMASFLYYDLTVRGVLANPILNFVTAKDSTIEGTVLREPEKYPNKTLLTIKTESVRQGEKIHKVKALIQATIYHYGSQPSPTFHYGDRLAFEGQLRKPPRFRNPGGFDYSAFLMRKKISAIVSLSSCQKIWKIGSARGNPLVRTAIYFKDRMLSVIHETLPHPHSALLEGILFGKRAALPEHISNMFTTVGVVHVLAVSGLHVGLIVSIFYWLFRLVRLSRKGAVGPTIVVIILYALMAGSRPSVVRAGIMAVVILVALCVYRQTDIYSSLALAALVILLVNPLALFDVGLQLSFIATLAIIYLYPVLWPRLKFLGSYPAKLLTVSLAAWIGVTPLLSYYFNRISPVAIIANLVVVPLVGIIVSLGFASALVAPASLMLARIFSNTNFLALTGLLESVRFFSGWPLAGMQVFTPSPLFVGAYFLGVIGFVNIRRAARARKIITVMTLLLVTVFVWSGILGAPRDELKVTFLDVGQGDSIFIQFPSHNEIFHRPNLLIDGGDGKFDTLTEYLLDQRVRRVDTMVLTHPDNDHLGGLLNVLSNFEVGRVLESGQKHNSPGYEKFLAIIERRGIPYHLVGDGSCIRVGPDIKIEVLHPKELLFYATQGETSNNNSTVMRLSYGEVSFLFTGDIEQPAEEELCNYGIQLHSTIIKVPHHGGPTSSSTKFLELVKPECAVISVGARNPFGHPSPETLKRYEILNTKIYRTDRDGAVIITADEKGFRVRTMSERWKPLAILD